MADHGVGPLLEECLDGHSPAERAQVDDEDPTSNQTTPAERSDFVSDVRLGIDVACRADHRASLADDRGEFLWSSWRFRTTTVDLERLWAKIPDGARVTVILEPTRNAWVPLAAWLKARGATVVLGATRNSRQICGTITTSTPRPTGSTLGCWLACPCSIPKVCAVSTTWVRQNRCAGPLRQRASMVKRRTTAGLRLDALVELLGPGWADTLGSGSYPKTSLVLLEKYADPRALRRLGRTRLTALLDAHESWSLA